MSHYKYMCLRPSNLSRDFFNQYNLTSKVTKYGYVYVEIRRGIYGIP